MALNTFSTFDLMIKYKLTMLLFLFSYMITMSHYQFLWITTPSRMWAMHSLMNIVTSLTSTSKMKNMRASNSIMAMTFIMMIFMNLSTMIPYGPSLSAHLMVDLSLCLPMWLSLVIISMDTPQMMISHYLPKNSMMSIAPFLSIVEGLSSMIRPLTLSFRLAANISAGHVIMAMMGVTFSIMLTKAITSLFITLQMIGAGYFTFELAICMVQAFVLTLLLIIYTNDYYISKTEH